MVTWHGTGSWQRRAEKVEAEVRPAGSSEDGNTGIAQEGFRLELGIGSEAPERCHRRGSAPYSSLTPVHHITSQDSWQASEKITSKPNISWEAFSSLCSTHLLKQHVILCLSMILCTRWALPCSLPCTPCCLCSERRVSFTGSEHPGLSAAGFCCSSSVLCSHEKGTWVERKASLHYCASPIAVVCFKAKKNTPSLEINFCFLKSHWPLLRGREPVWAAGGLAALLGWGSWRGC